MEAEDESNLKMPEALVELLRQCFQRNPDDRPKEFQQITGKIKQAYGNVVRQEYIRPEPKPSQLLADGLNNNAVSMLDLGRKEEAEKLYEQALKIDPHHPEVNYNRGLLLWRSGRMTDEELVRQLEEVRTTHRDDWKDEYLLGLVHIERGDAESAVEILEEAAKQASDEDDVQSALQAAKAGRSNWNSCIRSISGHRNTVRSVAISSNGCLALSGSGPDEVLKHWKGQSIGQQFIRSIAQSKDRDCSVRLWDLKTGKCLQTFNGHTELVASVAFSPDVYFALSGSYDGTIRLWNLKTGECVQVLACRGKLGTEDSLIRSITVLSVNEQLADSISRVGFTSDGQFAGSWSEDKTFRLWELVTGKCLCVVKANMTWFSQNFSLVIFQREDGIIEMWDPFKREVLWQSEEQLISLSSDGSLALFRDVNNDVLLRELATARCLNKYRWYQAVQSLCWFTANGKWGLRIPKHHVRFLAKGFEVYDVRSGRCVRTFVDDSAEFSCCEFSPDGKLVISGCSDNSVKVWQLADGPRQKEILCRPISSSELYRQIRQMQSLKKKAEAALISECASEAYKFILDAMSIPDYSRAEELLYLRRRIGMRGQILQFKEGWNSETFTLDVDKKCTVFTISPDFRFAVTLGNGAKVWELPSGRLLRELEGNNLLSVSRDGRFAVIRNDKDEVKLLETGTGKYIGTISGNIDKYGGSYIYHGGNFILFSKGESRTTRTTYDIWDFISGKRIKRIALPNYIVILSYDGRYVVSNNKSQIVATQLPEGCTRWKRRHRERILSPEISVSFDRRFLIDRFKNTVYFCDVVTGKCLKSFEANIHGVKIVALSPDCQFGLYEKTLDRTLGLFSLSNGACLREFGLKMRKITYLRFSPDSRFIIAGGSSGTVQRWKLVWDYEFPHEVEWDEGAQPYLERFFVEHSSGINWLGRWKRPAWNEEDFKKLLKELQYCGYGWLRPEGVRKKLEEMMANWQGPTLQHGKK
jgi:WD40 repeat protein